MLRKFKGETALLVNTVIWGATFVIIKNALADISPMTFIAFRFLTASLIMLPFLKKILNHLDKKTLAAGSILGFLYFAGFATQTVGLNYTSATKSGFITGTFVVFVPLLQLIISRKAPGRGNITGLALVVTGLILLSSRGDSLFDIINEIGTNFNFGDFLTLICAVLFAMYIVYLDMVSKDHPYLPLVFLQIILTGISGLIFTFLFSAAGIETVKFTINENVIFAVLYTAILATVITTSLQTKYQRFVSPTKAGIIFSMEPIFAALFAFLIINEQISSFGIFGGIFIFAGLLATEIIDKDK